MDEDGFNLMTARVAIVGLGLMGGSLALALRNHCTTILGVDQDQSILDLAINQRIVDYAHTDPANILPDADVIILAIPVPAILSLIGCLANLVPQACILMDIGSSKQKIVDAMSSLPDRFDTLGGHPICGKECLTLFNADAALYESAPFVLSTLERTSKQARACAQQIINAIGAYPLWIDAATHDATIATTSHLPYLLACALTLATQSSATPLIGPGFRSMTRLAATPHSMMIGVLQTNRENILNALCSFRRQLDALETTLREENIAALQELLKQGNTYIRELIS